MHGDGHGSLPKMKCRRPVAPPPSAEGAPKAPSAVPNGAIALKVARSNARGPTRGSRTLDCAGLSRSRIRGYLREPLFQGTGDFARTVVTFELAGASAARRSRHPRGATWLGNANTDRTSERCQRYGHPAMVRIPSTGSPSPVRGERHGAASPHQGTPCVRPSTKWQMGRRPQGAGSGRGRNAHMDSSCMKGLAPEVGAR